MTDYWVSTKKFFCEDCGKWFPERLRTHHMNNSIHKHKAKLRAIREKRQKNVDRKEKSLALKNLLLLQSDSGSKQSGYSAPIQRSTKNPSIGPTLPKRVKKPVDQTLKKKKEMESEQFEEYYKYFYQHFMDEEKEKVKKDKLEKMDVEAQVQVDVERKIQQLLTSGISLESMSLEDLMKLDGMDEEEKKVEKREPIIPPPKIPEVGGNMDINNETQMEKNYYNDPNFFYRTESEDYFQKKSKKEKIKNKEMKEKQKVNKIKNREMRKEFQKERKKMEKKRYYAQFQAFSNPKLSETGIGSWEDVEEEEEEDVSITGEKRNRDEYEEEKQVSFQPFQKRRKVSNIPSQRKSSNGKVFVISKKKSEKKNKGIKISFGNVGKKNENKKVKRKNVFG